MPTSARLVLALATLVVLTAAPLRADAPPAGVAPAEAYHRLLDGNARFAGGKLAPVRDVAKARAALTSSQSPFAVVLACSDSRVAPELVFDEGLGDLFIVRVAGNVVSPDGQASIEYAVEHLGSRLIVVMGHDSCGAVKAAITTPPATSTGSPALDGLLATLRTNIGAAAETPNDPLFHAAAVKNVDAVAAALEKRSKVVHDAVAAGTLRIVPAIYALDSGKVTFWGADGLK
jgi:carbonic anhydrase